MTELELLIVENHNKIVMRVSNECGDIDYSDIHNFFKKGYSRKGSGRGYGLYNVKKICNEYGAEIEVNLENREGKRWIHFGLTMNKSL